MTLSQTFKTAALAAASALVLGTGAADAAALVGASTNISGGLDSNRESLLFIEPFFPFGNSVEFAAIGLQAPIIISDLLAPGSAFGAPTGPGTLFIDASTNLGPSTLQVFFQGFTSVYSGSNPFFQGPLPSPVIFTQAGTAVNATASANATLFYDSVLYNATLSFTSVFNNTTVAAVEQRFVNLGVGSDETINSGVTINLEVLNVVPEPSPLPALLVFGTFGFGLVVAIKKSRDLSKVSAN
jgi:hypothetical protein